MEENSKYKSWSKLRKEMNDLLCDCLKDKITYFYTSYHQVHNSYGRATISYNKKEVITFSWIEMYKQEYEGTQEEWMKDGTLSNIDFIHSVTKYLQSDIKSSLNSDNYLLRVFAYLDRRVGKRTLINIKNDIDNLPEWVKKIYYIRCMEEEIN